jgi:hypothetical protein
MRYPLWNRRLDKPSKHTDLQCAKCPKADRYETILEKSGISQQNLSSLLHFKKCLTIWGIFFLIVRLFQIKCTPLMAGKCVKYKKW